MPTAIDTSVLIAAERGGNFFDFFAAIAATAMARGDALLALDGDFDRLANRPKLIKYPPVK